jgi:hypothetical protein
MSTQATIAAVIRYNPTWNTIADTNKDNHRYKQTQSQIQTKTIAGSNFQYSTSKLEQS